jgi:xylan 1,4-beta-xylosidase
MNFATIRKSILLAAAAFALISNAPLAAQSPVQTVTIDASAPARPFPHYWEEMFGSGRAILTLRDSWRRDAHEVQQITGFKYVRFHAILHDEVGVYDEDKDGKPIYNFSYVDQIYDGLLAAGIKPFVEISFMPNKLASRDELFGFWYKPNNTPPKDYAKWDALITEFCKHLIERYGIDEVASWYFEVWNEPNIDFWAGNPKQETYFELYDHTAKAVKAANTRLRVGGPSTAQAAWVDAMIAHATTKDVPLDFVSTHVYGNDTAHDVFKTDERIPRDQMVCRAVKMVHEQIKASSRPDIPLFWSEFNAAYDNTVEVTDSIYMGPFMANTISQCDGMTAAMSYWTLSDVFEEQGVVKQPFYGGFGLIAAGGIPKPAFYAFEILHSLGDQRIENADPNLLVTKASDGTLVVAAWNLVNPGDKGSPKTIQLDFKGVKPGAAVSIARVDEKHGDTLALYDQMGKPRYPTQAQVQQLRKESRLPAPEQTHLSKGKLTLELPVNGLAVIQVK